MQLTEHMRKHLIDGVIAAQKEGNPLLQGIDLQRLQTTLERDLTEDELSSVMLLVGSNRNESMRAMCLTMIDKKKRSPEPEQEQEVPQPRVPARGWKVERPAHGGFKHLTHRHPALKLRNAVTE